MSQRPGETRDEMIRRLLRIGYAPEPEPDEHEQEDEQ